MPTGAVGQLADPRRAWVHDFEAGATGRHDGPKVLDPFLDELLAALDRPRVAVLLDGTDAADSVLESALELVRGGIATLNVDVRVFHGARAPIDVRTAGALPFPLVALHDDVPQAFAAAADAWHADYVATFDSSGMYWGEDLVHLLAQVAIGRPAGGLGQPSSVGPRRARIVPAPLPAAPVAGRGQLRGQPCAEPAVSRALRPLRLGHAVGGAGGRAALRP